MIDEASYQQLQQPIQRACKKSIVSKMTIKNLGHKSKKTLYRQTTSNSALNSIKQTNILYIGETSNKLRFRLISHKKSIKDKSKGFAVAVHFSQQDHSQINLRCVIQSGNFKTTAERRICGQTF